MFGKLMPGTSGTEVGSFEGCGKAWVLVGSGVGEAETLADGLGVAVAWLADALGVGLTVGLTVGFTVGFGVGVTVGVGVGVGVGVITGGGGGLVP